MGVIETIALIFILVPVFALFAYPLYRDQDKDDRRHNVRRNLYKK
jgi:preprotein translocase subunit YajC